MALVSAQRFRTRLAMPLTLFLAMALLTTGACLRGMRTSRPRDPEPGDDGPLAQVCLSPHGTREVRSAIRLAHPLDEVWEVITDYGNYGDMGPFCQADAIHYDPRGTCDLKVRIDSGLATTLPCSVRMHHEQHLQEYIAWWDQPDGDVIVNRGRWVLRPLGPRETLLSVTLEVEVSGIPTFILRTISLHRLPRTLLGIKARLRTRGQQDNHGWHRGERRSTTDDTDEHR
jgi:hypothetical protein